MAVRLHLQLCGTKGQAPSATKTFPSADVASGAEVASAALASASVTWRGGFADKAGMFALRYHVGRKSASVEARTPELLFLTRQFKQKYFING